MIDREKTVERLVQLLGHFKQEKTQDTETTVFLIKKTIEMIEDDKKYIQHLHWIIDQYEDMYRQDHKPVAKPAECKDCVNWDGKTYRKCAFGKEIIHDHQ